MVRYNFFEGVHPSKHVQGAMRVNWSGAIYRTWVKQGGVEGRSKFGKFLISRTHYLWDVVGILLGRTPGSVRPRIYAARGGGAKERGMTSCVCIK